jgi:NAD(P)H dehydrogenase (quinone)
MVGRWNGGAAMNVLVVIAHPVKTSFCHKVLARIELGLKKAGHTVKVADLTADKFQAVMQAEDFVQFGDGPLPDDILAEQARIEWSDALVFIFPVWWWSVPGVFKGWIDRVFTYGWAWNDPSDPDSGSLRHRKILVLAAAAFAKRGYDRSLETQLTMGTWSYCGFKDVTMRIFHDLHDETPQEVGEGYLDDAEAMARNFA